jgi:hypothetical protein
MRPTKRFNATAATTAPENADNQFYMPMRPSGFSTRLRAFKRVSRLSLMRRNPDTMPRFSRFRLPPVIFVDVDGTLVIGGELNQPVADFCRVHCEMGYTLVLWSARGEDYARDAARRFDLLHLFAAILPKPGFILDDRAWTWTRHTRVLRMDEDMDQTLPPITL